MASTRRLDGRRSARLLARVITVFVLIAVSAGATSGAAAMAATTQKPLSDQATVARSVGDFGGDLYREVRAGNTVVSPLSVEYALAGLYIGSAGATHTELGRVLHAPPAAGRFIGGLGALDRAVNAAGGDGGDRPQLSSANALWADLSMTPRPEFAAATGSYGAELQQTDFLGAPAAALDTLNAWVDEHTMGRITNIFSPDSITSATRLVIANAVYFKGSWAREFTPQQTRPQTFHRNSGPAVRVATMHARNDLRYAEGPDWQAVELPYRGSDLSMLVIVPRHAIASIEQRLSGGFLAAVNRRLTHTFVTVALPKFELRSQVDLLGALRHLGAPQIAGTRPDLTGAFTDVRPGDLQVGAAVHQAFLHVDERGTEAAAATSALAYATSIPSGPPATITADRPFLAVIQQNSTGTPLFLARVMDPSRS